METTISPGNAASIAFLPSCCSMTQAFNTTLFAATTLARVVTKKNSYKIGPWNRPT
ncbi:hypothetical protein ACVBEH_19095 [Roseateles sp. GG27B]